jgi:hypothetical protein
MKSKLSVFVVSIFFFCVKVDAQKLVFKNGFEGTTAVVQKDAQHNVIRRS